MIKAIVKLDRVCVEIEGNDVPEIITRIKDAQFQTLLSELQSLLRSILDHNLSRSPSISEFVLSSTAESISDKVLLCMAYRSEYGEERVFNKIDVENLLFEIRETRPSNTNAMLNSLEKQGLLVRHRDKKQGLLSFYLSNKGLEHANELGGIANEF